jgi:hypothetical protein
MTPQEKIFIESCLLGHLASVKTCIEHNVDIHVEDDWCIEAASGRGKSKVVRYLLENGITHKSASTKSVLANACHKGDIELVKYLINASDEYKNDTSALEWSITKGNIEIVELMLCFVDNFDWSYCRASSKGHIHILNLLTDNNIYEYDGAVDKAIFWAAQRNKWSAVHFLIENNLGDINYLFDNMIAMYKSWLNDREL